MPYTLAERGDQFCVMKDDEELKCYDAKDDALAYLGALEANVEDANKSIYFGGAVKALDNGLIEGMLITFTSPQQKDLTGEYFDTKTNLHLPDYDPTNIRTLYHHGLDQHLGVKAIGRVVKSRIDDVGVWVQAQLNMQDEYDQAIMKLVKEGKLSWSSGALPQSVRVNKADGHIDEWAIIEASLTPTPAMPYTNKITSVKSLNGGILNAIEQLTVGRAEPNEAKDVKNETLANVTHSLPTKGKSMDMEQIKNVLRELLSSLENADSMVEDDAMEMSEKALSELPEATQKSLSEDQLIDIATKAVQAAFAKRDERQAKIKAQADAIKAQQKKNTPPNHSDYAPATTKSLDGKARISVGEERKYAHLSAEDMQLGYLMLDSATPPHMRGRQPAASDAYVRTMTAKTVAKLGKYEDEMDNFAVKSVLPFKANEFDATDISGQGQDWVGVDYGTRLWEVARNATIFNQLQAKGLFIQEIPQGAGSVVIPTEGADPIAYSSPQANDLDATGRPEVTAKIGFFGTTSVTLTPGQIKIALAFTDELVEDSVIPIVSNSNRQLQLKARETLDQAIINGDTATGASTNINLIDGTPGTGTSRPYYLAVNGLRKYPLVTNTAYSRSGGTLGIEDYRLTLKLMSSAVRAQRDDLLFIIDSDTENTSLAMPEIATDDVRRTAATITAGVLQKMYGIDVVTSGFLPLSNSSGKVPAAGGTLGQILLAYARYWAFGWKRTVRMDMEHSALSGTTSMVASMRFGFVARGADASAITYNLTIA